MCGRFTLHHTREEIEERFAAEVVPLLAAETEPRYNIAPTQTVLAVTEIRGGARLLGRLPLGPYPLLGQRPRHWQPHDQRPRRDADRKAVVSHRAGPPPLPHSRRRLL